MLNTTSLADLLIRHLPAEWQTGQAVTWNPQEYGQPPQHWLQTMWNYLVTQCSKDLSAFTSVPLVPISNAEQGEIVDLYPLSSNKVLQIREMDDLSLPKELRHILENIGVALVEELPDFISVHPLVMKKYVFSPSYIGVLHAFQRLVEIHGKDGLCQQFRDQTTAAEKRELRLFFAKISSHEVKDEYRQVLSLLPIFETVKTNGGEPNFVSYSQAKYCAVLDTLPVRLSQPVINVSSPECATLTRVLGMKELSAVQLLTKLVFRDIEAAFYEHAEVELVMLYVLRHYYSLLDTEPQLRDILRALPFLPRKDMLLTPDRFYDPDDQLLQKIFSGEENFPGGAFAESSIIVVLRALGLRGANDVEPQDLLESAFHVQDLVASGKSHHDRAAMKSKALMEFLLSSGSLLHSDCDGQPLAEALREVEWVEQLNSKPAMYPRTLPWVGSGRHFGKPSEMTRRQYSNLVGSVIPVAASDGGDHLCIALQWNRPPELKYIIQHLRNCVSHFTGTERAIYLEIARTIYSELSKHGSQELQELFLENQLEKWVWHGEGFATPEQLVFQEPFMDLRPFVYTFPAELQEFSDFFREFGVMDSQHLPRVLHLVKAKYDPQGVSHSSAEVKRDLHLCVSVLNELRANVVEEELAALQEELVLPVHTDNPLSLTLAPLLDCTYCDQEWVRTGEKMNLAAYIASAHVHCKRASKRFAL